MARDEKTVAQIFQNYVDSFQTLRPLNVTPYCDVPCLFISAQGVYSMGDAKALAVVIGRLMESLKSRGFLRSELTDVHVNQMSDNIAVVSARRIRYRQNGHELERMGETYTFRKVDGDWKIVTAVTHDADRLLQLVNHCHPANCNPPGAP